VTQEELVLKLTDMSNQLCSEKETGESLHKEKQELMEKIEIMSSEARDMVQAQDSLRDKIKFISKVGLWLLEITIIIYPATRRKVYCTHHSAFDKPTELHW
jgi:hypothetical protein